MSLFDVTFWDVYLVCGVDCLCDYFIELVWVEVVCDGVCEFSVYVFCILWPVCFLAICVCSFVVLPF